jgi:hypothetical protein
MRHIANRDTFCVLGVVIGDSLSVTYLGRALFEPADGA